MKHYLVCKETAKYLELLLDGKQHKIKKSWKDSDKVLELVQNFNDCKVVSEREAIYKQIESFLSPELRQELEKTDAFKEDAYGNLFFKDLPKEPLSDFAAKRVREYLKNGISLIPLINFFANLAYNPKKSVRAETYDFLEHNGHPITKNGYIVAYKAVNVKRKYSPSSGEQVIVYDEETGEPTDKKYTTELTYTSMHKGPYGGTIKVGKPVTMPRDECDNDSRNTCSEGLHVGSMEYVGSFGGSNSVILEVLINPMNIVSVPPDYNNTKMRVCEYYPYAISNGENSEIFLETDYDSITEEAREKLLSDLQDDKEKQVAELEEELKVLKEKNENKLL